MEEAINLSVTLDTEQFEQAIRKANELVDEINKVKALTNDLNDMVRELDFEPSFDKNTGGR